MERNVTSRTGVLQNGIERILAGASSAIRMRSRQFESKQMRELV